METSQSETSSHKAEYKSNGESSPAPLLGQLRLAYPMVSVIALRTGLLCTSYFTLFQVGDFVL